MNQMIRNHFEKLLLALVTAGLAVSCLWLRQQQPGIRLLRMQPIAAQLSGSAYELSGLRLPEATTAVWPKAPAQSHGSGWLYEVFTPPVIYYNTLARSFTVTPPLYLADGGTPFGLELLSVKLEPFRLQLVGYFGGPNDYLAAFTSPSQPETLLAREGRHFERLGLTFKSFEVKKVVVEHNDTWPVYDVTGLAVLLDDKTGAEVVLDSRARKLTDTPLAVFKLLNGDGKPRELHEGDTFTDDTSTYRIERIQLEPPEVVVAKQTPGLPLPETRVLHPGAQVAGESAKPLPAVAKHLPDGGRDKSRAGSSQQQETAGQTPAGQRAGTGPLNSDRPAKAVATNGN